MKKHQLEGARFGRLAVTAERVDLKTKKHRFYVCACDCGEVAVVSQAHLLSGHTISCGCYVRQRTSEALRKHGHSGNSAKHVRSSQIYNTWQRAKDRCHNPKNKSFSNYGGRGITMCEAWRNSFEAFLADVGERPDRNLSLDRINNDGNYEPGNVRWADWRTQRMNSRNPKRHGRSA